MKLRVRQVDDPNVQLVPVCTIQHGIGSRAVVVVGVENLVAGFEDGAESARDHPVRRVVRQGEFIWIASHVFGELGIERVGEFLGIEIPSEIHVIVVYAVQRVDLRHVYAARRWPPGPGVHVRDIGADQELLGHQFPEFLVIRCGGSAHVVHGFRAMGRFRTQRQKGGTCQCTAEKASQETSAA